MTGTDDTRSREPTPDKGGARKPFLLRLPPEVLDELRAWATTDFRSLNAHIEYLLREALKRRRGSKQE